MEIRANGLRFVARTWGDGPRRALLLHGFPDDADSMAPLAALLAAEGYRVVAPFLRGYHPSEIPADGDYSLATLAADAAGLMEALGGSSLLVGHDWGGAIACAAAQARPDLVERLVVLSVPPALALLRALTRPAQLRRSRYMFAFQLAGLAERRLRRDGLAGIEDLWRRWSPGWTPPPGRLAAVKATLASPGCLEAALSYYRAALGGPIREPRRWLRSLRLSQRPITPPSLVMYGAGDACIGPAAYRGLERAFTGPLRVVEVSGAGHFLPLEAPARIAAELRCPRGQPATPRP